MVRHTARYFFPVALINYLNSELHVLEVFVITAIEINNFQKKLV